MLCYDAHISHLYLRNFVASYLVIEAFPQNELNKPFLARRELSNGIKIVWIRGATVTGQLIIVSN